MHVVILAGLAGMIYRRLLVVTELLWLYLMRARRELSNAQFSLYSLFQSVAEKKHADVVECKAVMESI